MTHYESNPLNIPFVLQEVGRRGISDIWPTLQGSQNKTEQTLSRVSSVSCIFQMYYTLDWLKNHMCLLAVERAPQELPKLIFIVVSCFMQTMLLHKAPKATKAAPHAETKLWPFKVVKVIDWTDKRC